MFTITIAYSDCIFMNLQNLVGPLFSFPSISLFLSLSLLTHYCVFPQFIFPFPQFLYVREPVCVGGGNFSYWQPRPFPILKIVCDLQYQMNLSQIHWWLDYSGGVVTLSTPIYRGHTYTHRNTQRVEDANTQLNRKVIAYLKCEREDRISVLCK